MIHTIVFFGASSSQAVHPERASHADLATAAANGITKDTRELLLSAKSVGAQVNPMKYSFVSAKESLDKGDAAACVGTLVQAMTNLGGVSGPAKQNLKVAVDFLVADQVATASGVDTRDAEAIFEASTSQIGLLPQCFASARTKLTEAIASAETGARARTGDVLKLLKAPEGALSIAGVA